MFLIDFGHIFFPDIHSRPIENLSVTHLWVPTHHLRTHQSKWLGLMRKNAKNWTDSKKKADKSFEFVCKNNLTLAQFYSSRCKKLDEKNTLSVQRPLLKKPQSACNSANMDYVEIEGYNSMPDSPTLSGLLWLWSTRESKGASPPLQTSSLSQKCKGKMKVANGDPCFMFQCQFQGRCTPAELPFFSKLFAHV